MPMILNRVTTRMSRIRVAKAPARASRQRIERPLFTPGEWGSGLMARSLTERAQHGT